MYNTTNTGCELYGSLFENIIQLFLGIVAVTTLTIKWRLEEDIYRRPYNVFCLDAMKQCFTGLFDHGIHIFIAIKMAHLYQNTDKCAWYFVSYLFDTVLGTYIAYYIVLIIEQYASDNNITYLKKSGDYGDYSNTTKVGYIWLLQTLSWALTILVSRTFVGFVVWMFYPLLVLIVNSIAGLFIGNPDGLFVVVMVMCPGVMNIVQVWVQDHILKAEVDIRGILDDELMHYNENTDDIEESR